MHKPTSSSWLASVLVVLLVSALVLAQQESSSSSLPPLSILCPTNKKLTYKFKSSTLLGTQPHLRSASAIKNGKSQENTIAGKMKISCVNISGPSDKKKKSLFVVSFPKAQFLQFQGLGKNKSLPMRKHRVLNHRKNLREALNKFPLGFVQSENGQISRMIFSREEPHWVRSIKKGLLRMLTTETIRGARNQTDGFGGKYKQSYDRKPLRKSPLIQITQQFTNKDFNKVLKRKKHLVYEGTHIVNVNPQKGLITKALFGTRLSLGGRFKSPSFALYEKMSNTTLKDKAPQKNDQVQSLHIGSLVLQDVADDSIDQIAGSMSKFFSVKDGKVILKPGFVLEKSFGLSKDEKKSIRKVARDSFKTSVFERLVRQAERDTETKKKMTDLTTYMRRHPVKAAKILINKLASTSLKLKRSGPNQKLVKFMESVQNLIAPVNNERIQNKLATLSIKVPELAKGYIYSSILVKKPTKTVFNVLKTLKTTGLNTLFNTTVFKTASDEEGTKSNAFMAWADLASRLTDKELKSEIVSEIFGRMTSSKDEQDFTTAIHAMNNAGSAIPLSIIKNMILAKEIPDFVKNLVTENIKKRLFNDTNVDNLINFLIKKVKTIDASVISSLIGAQTERERNLKNATSVLEIGSLFNKTNNELIHQAIKQYLYVAGTNQSAALLDTIFKYPFKQEEEAVEAEDFELAGDDEEKAKLSVSDVATKLKNFFTSASWAGASTTCLPASTSSQICLYNNDMVNFVKQQGDLSKINKAKFYAYENLWGTKSVSVYFGTVVYGGATLSCADSNLDFVFFGRAAADVTLFDQSYPAASAYVQFNNRGGSKLTNKVYVKLLTTTFVDGTFLPDYNVCFTGSKNIIQKSFPSLFQHSYYMTIGPFPVSFSFLVGLQYSVDLNYGYCLNSLSASAALVPTVGVNIGGSADIGIPLAKAGIALTASATCKGIPELSTSKCNLCASLKFAMDAASFDVTAKGKVLAWEKSFSIYSYTLPIAYSKTLYEQCVRT